MLTNTTIRCKLLIILLLSAGLVACNKLLDVPTPPNEIGIDAAFNDSASAVSAVTGIYNRMVLHGFFEWSGLSYFAARSADEAVSNSYLDLFARDSLLYTNTDVQSMWTQGFESLLMINTCLRGLQSTNRLSATLHRQLLGETLFCRAFVNFYLVNIWGDAIPLITSPDVDVNQTAKSVPRQQMYDQIISDLKEAQGLLTNMYPTSFSKGRPNLMAANALLARVYLYQGRYSDAITQATTVIGSNLYFPLPPPASAFVAGTKEAIWQLMPPTTTSRETVAVGDATIYLLSATSLTPQLLAAFEPGDLRRQSWVVDNIFSGATYTTANKYKRHVNNSMLLEYYTVLRLAEQYLIRAEAYTRLGQIEAAIADLNVVRARAGLPALPGSLTQQQCMSAVEHERQVELFTEWGHRWFDLKRWPGITNPNVTRADEVLGAIKPDWQPTDQWYPVPRSELQLNAFLVQNPGYPAR
ncbi:MAG TPA: RagB/SusD family nutrient uptake outer membrane protein [Niastella sp.]